MLVISICAAPADFWTFAPPDFLTFHRPWTKITVKIVTFNEAFRSSSLLFPEVAGTTLAALSLASKVMMQATVMRKPVKKKI